MKDWKNVVVALCVFAFALSRGGAAEQEINIEGEAKSRRVIPVSLSGFDGEVASVLRFDLEVLGFKIVGASEAEYLIAGSNDGQVKGQVTTREKVPVIPSRAYTGGSLRTQAHTFANDIIKKLRGVDGIGFFKMVYKMDSGENKVIYYADGDGYGARAVTPGSSLLAAPAVSKGRLFYTSYELGTPAIFVQTLQTGERKVISKFSGLNTSPAISPDGNTMAMILSRKLSPDLWIMNLQTGETTQLTSTKEEESSPCWSPDGRTICFASRVRGPAGLYTMPASGGQMRRLPVEGAGNMTEPDWSPDGKWIAFTTQIRSGFLICVVPAQGGKVEVVADGEDPSWAPNSRTILYTRRKGGSRSLSLLDVPTKQIKDVPHVKGSCSQPSWVK